MSSTELPATLGFVGKADASEELVAAELDNFLPQDVDGLVLPEKITRQEKGLSNVFGWLTKEFGADAVDTEDNVVEVLKAAKDEGESVALVVLWGDGDDATYKIIEAAVEAGIPAYDLTQGMDVIEIEDEPEDTKTEPAPDEAESDAAPRSRRSRRTRTPEAAETASEPQEGKRQPRSRRAQAKVEEAIKEAASDEPPFEPNVNTEPPAQEASGLSTEELAAFIDAQVSGLFHDFAVFLTERVRAKNQTYTLVKDEDGNYSKKGRGRPRAGSQVVELTLEQVKELGLEDLIS